MVPSSSRELVQEEEALLLLGNNSVVHILRVETAFISFFFSLKKLVAAR